MGGLFFSNSRRKSFARLRVRSHANSFVRLRLGPVVIQAKCQRQHGNPPTMTMPTCWYQCCVHVLLRWSHFPNWGVILLTSVCLCVGTCEQHGCRKRSSDRWINTLTAVFQCLCNKDKQRKQHNDCTTCAFGKKSFLPFSKLYNLNVASRAPKCSQTFRVVPTWEGIQVKFPC